MENVRRRETLSFGLRRLAARVGTIPTQTNFPLLFRVSLALAVSLPPFLLLTCVLSHLLVASLTLHVPFGLHLPSSSSFMEIGAA